MMRGSALFFLGAASVSVASPPPPPWSAPSPPPSPPPPPKPPPPPWWQPASPPSPPAEPVYDSPPTMPSSPIMPIPPSPPPPPVVCSCTFYIDGGNENTPWNCFKQETADKTVCRPKTNVDSYGRCEQDTLWSPCYVAGIAPMSPPPPGPPPPFAPPTPPPSPFAPPGLSKYPNCVNILSNEKCSKKATAYKCQWQKKVWKKCQKTCEERGHGFGFCGTGKTFKKAVKKIILSNIPEEI